MPITDAGEAEVQRFADQVLAPQSAAELELALSSPAVRYDPVNDRQVVAGAERTVQVHHVNPAGALLQTKRSATATGSSP